MSSQRFSVLLSCGLFLLLGVATPAWAQDDDLDDFFDDGLDELLGETEMAVEESSALTGWQGYFELLGRVYPRDRDQGKSDEQLIFEAEMEFDFRLGEDTTGYFRPRIRVDMVTTGNNRFAPYEAYITHAEDDWDARAGQFVENWGIADTYNPIDIINRRDLASDILDTDRLGELGFRYRRFLEGGETLGEPTVSAYLLPIWLPTPFPSSDSRFGFDSPNVSFDPDEGFEPSGSEGVFSALRYQSTWNTKAVNSDLQILAARGPERMPNITLNAQGDAVPAYYGANTVGFGLRAVPNQDELGDFLASLTLKAEVVYKDPYVFDDSPISTPDDYLTFVLGVDRAFYDVVADQDQLTMTVEYSREEGADDETTLLRPFGNDLILRGFWEANDFARTSVELRGLFDVQYDERIFELLVERQLRSWHEDVKLIFQAVHFNTDSSANTLFSRYPNNSSVALGVRWDF